MQGIGRKHISLNCFTGNTAMSQNTSSAVMQQRKEPNDSAEDFPTPPWAARALMEYVLPDVRDTSCWEPAANRGYLVRGLEPYFAHIEGSDVHDYGAGFSIADFLFPSTKTEPPPAWVVTNPPFRLCEEFIVKAMDQSQDGCAMLVRTAFLESVGRYERLFRLAPPTIVAFFTERVPMVKGRCDPKASTATSYSWLVWRHGCDPEAPVWIPPCRKLLEKPGDYDLPQP